MQSKRLVFHSWCWIYLFLALLAPAVLLGCAAQETPESAPESGQSQLSMSEDTARSLKPAATEQSTSRQSTAPSGQLGATGQSGAAGGQSATDGPMSNGYRVGPDGRLLQPDQGNLTPPELPEEAKQHTPEGAQAYAEHYIALLSYALKTGDTDELKANYSEECKSCQDRTDRIEKHYGNKGWYDGEGHLIAQSYPAVQLNDEDRTLDRWGVYLVLHTPPYKEYLPDGTIKASKASRTEALIDNCWGGDAWKVCGTDSKELGND